MRKKLMRKKCRHRVIVWDLFRSLPQPPAWSSLPVEVRQKATRLLARLLAPLLLGTLPTCRRGAAAGKEAAGKEVGDE